jgi:hypothetical protein
MAKASSALSFLLMQHVSTQKYLSPPCRACFPQNRIFLYPGFVLPLPVWRSAKVTSSLSAPQVCESIAYGGMLLSFKLWMLSSLLSLYCKSRIACGCVVGTCNEDGTVGAGLISLIARSYYSMVVLALLKDRMFAYSVRQTSPSASTLYRTY